MTAGDSLNKFQNRHAYVHFGLGPSCRGRASEVRSMSETWHSHIFETFSFETSTKTKALKSLWFQIRRFDGHASLVSDTSSTLTFPVGWLLDVPLWCKIHRMWTWRTSRATEKTTWCKDMQISWLFGKISVKHVFFEDPCRVGQWRTT